jgi:hypothetical protein
MSDTPVEVQFYLSRVSQLSVPHPSALMLEQNDEWAVTRRYMSLETVAQVCEDHAIDVAKIAAL